MHTTKSELRQKAKDIARDLREIRVREESDGRFSRVNRSIGELLSMVDHLPDENQQSRMEKVVSDATG